MIKKLLYSLFVVTFIFSLIPSVVLAQSAEEEVRTQEIRDEERLLRGKIEAPRKLIKREEEPEEEPLGPEFQQKTLVKEINVLGYTLLSKQEVDEIISPYKNQELTLREIQKITNLITDAYRQKGYVTSRAYLPEQKIKKGLLEIKVLEGKTGTIEIKGNKHFKTKLLRDKIALGKGEPFDYDLLRRGLTRINEQPDRNARTVLMPGKEPGSTDVVLEVEDNLPIHVGFEWDNFGSRYIGEDRYLARFTHNNLLGRDDKLTLQYQKADSDHYFLRNATYMFPVGLEWEVGFYAAASRVKLGEELRNSNARGNSRFYSVFANRPLINKDNFDLGLNLGFDYKNITNFQDEVVSSRNKLRVAKIGLDMYSVDEYGRSLVTGEFDVGIPNIMGGLKSEDALASRAGAGGKFLKYNLNFLRLHKMPFSSTLLWKNQVMLSPYALTSAEQFQIGGIANVRGYPPASLSGDRGYATTLEWSFPTSLIPSDIKVPYSEAKVSDALRVAVFWDWANAHLKSPTGTEEKSETLKSFGCGFRFDLPEDFSVRFDLAWPIDKTPSDGDHAHSWIRVKKGF